ncbi:MAG: HEAT repeat domain-containing protein [Fusobacteriaceae bacterium]
MVEKLNNKKSDLDLLRKRGYIENYDLIKFSELDKTELIKMLHDEMPVHRSIASKVLGLKYGLEDEQIVDALLEQLSKEKKLYTRLEICSTLENGSSLVAKKMISYLGKIGSNQHKFILSKPSLKSSYPLPRDLISRSLARMKREIMPVLLEVLDSDDLDKISEILDAIGFLAFYDKDATTMQDMNKVIETIEKYSNNKIIFWKGIICLSAFPFVETKKFLQNIIENNTNNLYVEEAKRSLKNLKYDK